MSGFVEHLTARHQALRYVAEALGFPWELPSERKRLVDARGRAVCGDIIAPESIPAFDRSLRDGYAVRSVDVRGASPSSPAFLSVKGEVPMGKLPNFSGTAGSAAALFTGGAVPEGYDTVIMAEDTSRMEDLLEVRCAGAPGDFLVKSGEDVACGDTLLRRGEMIDARTALSLAALGITELEVSRVRVGILSTGDEIVAAETPSLLPGCVRDANASFLTLLFQELGCHVTVYGIVSDVPEILQERFLQAQSENDVVLLSGGSSVSTRDLCVDLLRTLPAPGLLVRGVNIAPGKPTLIAGSREPGRLVVGLPGHPLSCAVVARMVVVPLVHLLRGGENSGADRQVLVRAGSDVIGKMGVEEFFPGEIRGGTVWPILAKSGYVRGLQRCGGLIRLPENRETVRGGEEVEVCLW